MSLPCRIRTGLQHETKCKEFKMSQRVPATKKIKESSLQDQNPHLVQYTILFYII